MREWRERSDGSEVISSHNRNVPLRGIARIKYHYLALSARSCQENVCQCDASAGADGLGARYSQAPYDPEVERPT